MSQNASSRNKGLDKGPVKSFDSTSTHSKHSSGHAKPQQTPHTALKQPNTASLDENHNTKETNIHTIVPSADQVRLAQLIGNKSEDPEINKKIKQVVDVVSRPQEEILMVLHELDYNVTETIEFLLDGRELSQDWKTAGKQKKPAVSPNQTLDDAEHPAQNNNHQFNNKPRYNNNTNNNNNNNNNKYRGDNINGQSENRNRDNNNFRSKSDRPRKFLSPKFRNNENESNQLEDKFAAVDFKESGDKSENVENFQNNQESQYNNRNYINKRNNNFNPSTRGGSRGGRGGGRGGTRGGYNGYNRPQNNYQRKGDNFEQGNDEAAHPDEVVSNLDNPVEVEVANVGASEVTETKLNEQATKSHEDSLRDIGTWSNEQAAHRNNRRQNNFNNNRYTNKPFPHTGPQPNPNEEVKLNDDLENDEEWQGDLNQTQIFTPTVQKKEESSNETVFAKSNEFESDFPIGHFNAEEAAQKIKNAVGIVSQVVTKTSVVEPVKANNSTKPDEVQAPKQQQAAPARVNKIGSVKPPPPSTKIPKSAVIMPDGSSNGFNLDVQFGVDLDTPITSVKTTVAEAVVVAKEPQPAAQTPLPQRQPKEALSNNMNNLNDQKIGVVNPVVVNKTPVNAVKANVEPAANAVLNIQLQDSSAGLEMSSMQKGNLNQQTVSNSQPKVNSQPAENKKPSHENFADKPGQQSAFRRSQMTSLPQSVAQPVVQQMPNKPYMNQLGNDVAAATILTNNNINNQRENHQMSNHHSQHYQQQQQLNHSQIKTSGSSQNIASNVNLNSSQNSNSNTQMLNQISPQNSKQISQQQQQQQMVMQQVTNLNQQNVNNPTNLAAKQNSLPNNSNNVNANGNNNSNNNVMAPPPGVNMINPNNQFMMSLPFVCYDQQNLLPYFDPTQIDGNSIMQMYNHLTNLPPPGVGTNAGTGGAAAGPPYSINDTKFNRTQDANNTNSQLNPNPQLSQQQQQQPINMIPGLSNFPLFFHNYYPNMFMSMPQNGPQANPQFQNKPPYNFNNAGNGVNDYEVQNKDYSNYNTQIKPTGSNINSVSEITGGYQKNVDKSNAGYHTPPPNYATTLINQQQQQSHQNVSGNSGVPPQPQPAQFTYITSMIGTPGGNPLVHAGMQQENMNPRSLGNNNGSNNLKLQPKTANYQNSTWS